MMMYSSFGMTRNAHAIVNSITIHGKPVFHTPEMHLKPYLCRDSVCNLADIIAVYQQSCRFYIVGIEIKEWKAPVYPKIAEEYLQTYRKTCEYFYLAAKRFSKRAFELDDIGLFDLTRMEVVKKPGYLYPDPGFRGHLMKRIKKHFLELPEVVEDPFQRTLSEFRVTQVLRSSRQ
ncbi:MAG: hypothetical protein ACNA7I_04700 [Candidatus Methanoperedens sp.]